MTSSYNQKVNFNIGNWLIKPSTLTIENKEIGSKLVEPRVMEVLCLLADAQGQLVTRQDLHEKVWQSSVVSDAAVNRIIARLRKLLKDDARNPSIIKTVSKRGYQLILPVAEEFSNANVFFKTTNFSRPKLLALFILVSSSVLILINSDLPNTFLAIFQSNHSQTKGEILVNLLGSNSQPQIAQNKRFLAFTNTTERFGRSSVYVKDLSLNKYLRITTGQFKDDVPSWSDNNQLLFIRRDSSGCQVRRHRVDWKNFAQGSEEALFRCAPDQSLYEAHWEDETETLLLALQQGKSSPSSLFRYNIQSKKLLKLLSPSDSSRGYVMFKPSPDGTLVALIQDKWEKYQLQIVELKTSKIIHQFELGPEPGTIAWKKDGQSIVFISTPYVKEYSLLSKEIKILHLSNSIVLDHAIFDDENIILSKETHGSDIGIMNLSESYFGDENKLAINDAYLMHPRLSKKNNKVAYLLFNKDSENQIWIKENLTSEAKLISDIKGSLFLFDWSPDERYLIAVNDNKAITIDTRTKKIKRISPQNWHIVSPVWSHDGNSIYFSSNQTGSWEIWQQTLENNALKQITQHTGWMSSASIDGKYLFYSRKNGSGVWQFDLKTKEEIFLFNNTRNPFWPELFSSTTGIYFVDKFKDKKSMMFFRFDSRDIKHVFNWPNYWGTQINFNHEFDQIIFENFGVIEGHIEKINISPSL